MTNTISDIEKADVLLVTGSNTTENHPVLSSYIKRATLKGTKLIVIDPRQIKLTKFATYWLRPELGTDVAWINGLMNVIINEELYDKEYVEKRTVDFEKLKETVQKFTPEYVEGITCIPAEEIKEAARTYAQASAGSILYCMGITQHRTGTDNVKSLANLAMLCGNVGIEGGGVNPLRGQNNVQGACDMGGLPNVFSGYQKVTDSEARNKMEKAWQVSGLSEQAGLTATEMVPLAEEGKFKSLYVIGENPLVSDPDLSHAEKSIKNLDFLVVQDLFLTETAQLADVVLPSCSYAEKDGTFTNTERRVQKIRKAVNPPGQAKTDWEIICDLSSRMGYPMEYKDSRAIMEEIASVTPSYGGITYERIEDVGVHWPCFAPCDGKEHPGTPILHCESFACGLGVFNAVDCIPPAEQVDEEFPVYLTTGRVLYQYHTGTMTRKSEGLNEKAPECFVEISPEDLKKYGLEDGNLVKISSRRGSIVAKAQKSTKSIPGTVFIPFHYAESAANMLTNTALDPVAKIPELKVCAVNLAQAG